MTRVKIGATMAAPRTATVTTKRTVTVACKIPHGLDLRLHRMVKKSEPVLGGGYRDSEIAEPYGDVVKIRGPAIPWGMGHPDIIYGVRLTHDVDTEFFAEWLKQNSKADYVKNGMIYAFDNKEDVIARAKEEVKELSGLEPIDVSTKTEKGVTRLADPRIPRATRGELSPIQKGDKEMTER